MSVRSAVFRSPTILLSVSNSKNQSDMLSAVRRTAITRTIIRSTPKTLTVSINRSFSQQYAAKMVKTLPFADIEVPVPGFGAMGISFVMGTNLTPEEAEPLLLKAIELGCTFWDTAVSHQQYRPRVPAKDCQKLTGLPHVGCLFRWN